MDERDSASRSSHDARRGSRWRVAIVQSNYIPWKGFFDLIGRCDEYIMFDSVQYARRHWHNRNKVMTASGPSWLTIPVNTKSRFTQAIEDVEVAEPWAETHWRTMIHHYRRAACFDDYRDRIGRLYTRAGEERLLTRVNELFLRDIASMLTPDLIISRDRDYAPEGTKTDRLLSLCQQAGATHYLSGPSARTYLETDKFTAAGIAVEWMEYGPYAEYPQLGPAFDHAVTVLDVLFNAGPETARLCAPLPRQHA